MHFFQHIRRELQKLILHYAILILQTSSNIFTSKFYESILNSQKNYICARAFVKDNNKFITLLFFRDAQKAKLKSIFYYYNYLETEHALDGHLIISRQVFFAITLKFFFDLSLF